MSAVGDLSTGFRQDSDLDNFLQYRVRARPRVGFHADALRMRSVGLYCVLDPIAKLSGGVCSIG